VGINRKNIHTFKFPKDAIISTELGNKAESVKCFLIESKKLCGVKIMGITRPIKGCITIKIRCTSDESNLFFIVRVGELISMYGKE
jgi:hypothetical protein